MNRDPTPVERATCLHASVIGAVMRDDRLALDQKCDVLMVAIEAFRDQVACLTLRSAAEAFGAIDLLAVAEALDALAGHEARRADALTRRLELVTTMLWPERREETGK